MPRELKDAEEHEEVEQQLVEFEVKRMDDGRMQALRMVLASGGDGRTALEIDDELHDMMMGFVSVNEEGCECYRLLSLGSANLSLDTPSAHRRNQGSPKVAGRSNTLIIRIVQSWQLLCLCELLQPFNIIDENGFGFAVGRLSPRLSLGTMHCFAKDQEQEPPMSQRTRSRSRSRRSRKGPGAGAADAAKERGVSTRSPGPPCSRRRRISLASARSREWRSFESGELRARDEWRSYEWRASDAEGRRYHERSVSCLYEHRVSCHQAVAELRVAELRVTSFESFECLKTCSVSSL